MKASLKLDSLCAVAARRHDGIAGRGLPVECKYCALHCVIFDDRRIPRIPLTPMTQMRYVDVVGKEAVSAAFYTACALPARHGAMLDAPHVSLLVIKIQTSLSLDMQLKTKKKTTKIAP